MRGDEEMNMTRRELLKGIAAMSAFAALGGDTPMKIMTYNVFYCESTRGGRGASDATMP